MAKKKEVTEQPKVDETVEKIKVKKPKMKKFQEPDDGVVKIDLKELEIEYNLPEKTNYQIIDILIKRRDEYRESNNYKKSDEIRNSLLDFNIELEDSTEQTEWFWRDS